MADDLRSLLDGMGETADEVADFLRGQGCQGLRHSKGLCPVAMYLLRHLSPPISHVSVRDDRTFLWRRTGELEEKVFNSPAVSAFIRNFDVGAYPDLIHVIKT